MSFRVLYITPLILLSVYFFTIHYISAASSSSSEHSVGSNSNNLKSNQNKMGGQVGRIMTYPMSENMKNAKAVLHFQNYPLSWYRLDDGVMGGRSETHMDDIVPVGGGDSGDQVLVFSGRINTNGGGFTSIRSALPESGLPKGTEAIRIRYRGDGKTYKLLLSAGQQSVFSRGPSWQMDLPTESRNSSESMQEAVLPLCNFLPSFGPRSATEEQKKTLSLVPQEQRQIGLMLSLKVSYLFITFVI